MKTLFITSLILFLGWIGHRTVNGIKAEQSYLGYLKRASNANSIEIARTQLSRAVWEIKRRELTEGYTSILYTTPNDDVGFWYSNLKSSLEELEGLDKDSSPLEKSNMLLKLREVLLDSDKVIYPKGISVYPYNVLIAVWGWLSLTLTITFGIITGIRNNCF